MAKGNILGGALNKIHGISDSLGRMQINEMNKISGFHPKIAQFAEWHEGLGERNLGYNGVATLATLGVGGTYLSAKKMRDPNSNKAMDVVGGFTEAKAAAVGVQFAGIAGLGLYGRFLKK